MRRPAWLLPLTVVVALAVALSLTLVGYVHRGHHVAGRNRAVVVLRHQLTESERAQRQAENERRAVKSQLASPGHGPIPRWLRGYKSGRVSAFAPRNSIVKRFARIPAGAGKTREVVVIWTARPQHDQSTPDSGFLLWQATRSHPVVANGPYQAPVTWRVIDEWNLLDRGHLASYGPPGKQRSGKDPDGAAFSFSTGDLTGDGHRDVLVSFDGDGSGGCSDWRVLSVGHGVATSIFNRRELCDGYVRIRSGLLEVNTPVYGPSCGIHGCGTYHRRLLRWTGSSWAVVSRTIAGTPNPT